LQTGGVRIHRVRSSHFRCSFATQISQVAHTYYTFLLYTGGIGA
jgi:hypothetical protein